MLKTCKKCKNEFPDSIVIDGKRRNLQRRVYCLGCSPFGLHNTKDLETAHLVVDGRKKCSRCNKTKPTGEFYKGQSKRDGYHAWCKKCFTDSRRELEQRFKALCVKYKGGKCEQCDYDKHQAALEFHHRNPEDKEFDISSFTGAKTYLQDIVIKELDKCTLVCANCHRVIHASII